jgi:hypothetical protein
VRRLLVVLVAVAACSSSGSPSTIDNEIPPDLVPASAEQASITVTRADQTMQVPAAVVSEVVPFLVRRVFEPTEPLSSYGLDRPVARVDLAMPDGSTITLHVGGQDFDATAYFVQRNGDGRIWLVLTKSIAPLLDSGN